jgi:hypothetical protein
LELMRAADPKVELDIYNRAYSEFNKYYRGASHAASRRQSTRLSQYAFDRRRRHRSNN